MKSPYERKPGGTPYKTHFFCGQCGVWVPKKSEFVKRHKRLGFIHDVSGCGKKLRTHSHQGRRKK